jgi:DNA repair exonuclease SbcCD ATPase subunit/DNA repair exonuclease SbcCD nuclease subunit
MITILKSDIQKYKWIVHCGDIHIRLNKRKEEYINVFNTFFKSIKDYPKNETIIVNTGDLFHTKLDLQPEGIKLAETFLRGCSDLFPTIIIAGNHDCNLSNKTRLDSISPVVDAIRHPNLFYLKKSGLYSLGNICINNYSIFDSSENYIKGKDIQQIYRNKYEHFICLFHGQVDGSMTDLGFKLSNPTVPISMFDEHDISMLGDIHKLQDLQEYDYDNNKPVVRYPGSLCQQNHAEPLIEHGYTLWDLESKTYKHVEIPNEYGFFSVLIRNGVIMSDTTNIPKKARIRIQHDNCTPSEIKAALVHVKGLTEVIEVSYQKLDTTKSLTRIPSANGNIVLGDINDTNYQVTLITDYLKTKLNVVDQTIIDGVIKINNDVNNVVKKDEFARNIRWIPIRFEWENMFSYAEGNVIDFTKTKDLVGLFAANTSGKSSIFSALTFCLFDKCERASGAKSIMNDKKTTFSCKFEFELDGKRYFIKRDAKTDKKGKAKVDVKFWKIENGEEVDLNGEQRRNTNEVIREYLGSYDDFVLTSLSVQNGKNNASIIDMGDTDRKDLFAQFMGLTVFDRLYTEGNERLKELLVMLKTYRNDDYTSKLVEYQNFLEQAELLYESEQQVLAEIGKRRDLIQQTILETTKKLIKIDGDIPKLGYSQMMLEKEEQVLNNAKSKIVSKEKEVEIVAGQLTQVELEITNLESKNVSDLSSQLRLFQETKRNIEDKREQLKANYLRDMKIFDRARDIDYNPDCEFCVKHAGAIAQDAKDAKERMEKIQTEASEIKAKLDIIDAKITEIQWSHEANLNLMSFLSKRNTLKDSRIRLTDDINALRQHLTKIEGEVKKHQTNIELYNKNIESMTFNEDVKKQIGEFEKELVQVEHSHKTKTKTLMDINSKMSVCKNQINDINDKISKIKLVEEEYKLYEIYCQAVSRDGIPFEVITATVPEIQNEVNSILSQVSEFTALFETDGKNIIPYIVYDGRQWLMSLTSGFEKFALSLAIRVALINISNLPKMPGLVIDEGFGVLDADNLSQMESLFSYLKSRFDFIIIISHLEALRDIVDSHIEVKKENGFSKVEYK